MNSNENGYVTVEHTIGFVAVTLVVGVIIAAAQAGMTGTSLCQVVREDARAASTGQTDPQGAASAAYLPGSYEVKRTGGWVSVTGTAPYRGAAGWIGGIARCSVTTIDEGDLSWHYDHEVGGRLCTEVSLSCMGVPATAPTRKGREPSVPRGSLSWPSCLWWSLAVLASPTASRCACRPPPT